MREDGHKRFSKGEPHKLREITLHFMYTTTKNHLVTSTIFAVLSICIGIIILIGYGIGSDVLASLFTTEKINPLVAVAFLLCGIAIILTPKAKEEAWVSQIGITFLMIVLVLMIMRLVGVFSFADIGIDLFLFPDQIDSENRLSTDSAIAFLFLTLAIIFVYKTELMFVVHNIASVSFFLALLSLINIFYNVPDTEFQGFGSIPLGTLIGIIILVSALLFLRKGEGYLVSLESMHMDGVVARFLYPAVLIVPILIGGIMVWLETPNALLSFPFLIALFVIFTIIILFSMTQLILALLRAKTKYFGSLKQKNIPAITVSPIVISASTLSVVLTALGIILILQYGTVTVFSKNDLAQHASYNISVNDHIAKEIQLFIEGKINRVVDFSSDGFIKDSLFTMVTATGDAGNQTAQLLSEHLRKNKIVVDTDFFDVFTTDRNGIIVASTEPQEIGLSLVNSTTFLNGKHIPIAEEMVYDTILRTFTITLAAPVIRNGEFVGIVGIKMIPSRLYETVTKRDITYGTLETFLINKDNLLLTPTRRYVGAGSDVLVQEMRTDVAYACNEARKTGTYTTQEKKARVYVGHRGVDVLGSFTVVPLLNWCLITEINVSELSIPLSR